MNTKLIESINLKELRYLPMLGGHTSNNRSFTRHWANLGLTESVDVYVMFGWLVFMSNGYNIFDYSLALLKQYKQASVRANEIYKAGKVKQCVSVPKCRDIFTYMIESGLVIRLESGKNRFMINPLIVYNNQLKSFKAMQSEINKMILDTGGSMAPVLIEYCNHLEKLSIEKEKVTQKAAKKRDEAKSNKSKRR